MAPDKREQSTRQRLAQVAAEKEAAAQARRRRNTILGVVVAVVVVAAAVGGLVLALTRSSGTTNAAANPSATGSAAASASASASPTVPGANCSYPPAPLQGTPAAGNRTPGLPPSGPADTKGTYTLTMTTNQGVVVAKLDAVNAPCTVNAMSFLASKKYFDGTSCHRLTSFALQCGDPTGTGSGSPGFTFADENLAGAKYPVGTLAMANAGPDTNGSQFFFVTGDASSLPPSYTSFGTVTAGLDVLQKVAAGGNDGSSSDGSGKPKLPVQISTLTVAKS